MLTTIPFFIRIKKTLTPVAFLLLLLLLILCLPQCTPNEDPLPAYIKIDSTLFTAEPTQGTAQQKIEAVWLYNNNVLQGVYELPATIPIIETGNRNIIIQAAVANSGRNDWRLIYPFFTAWENTVSLTPLETVTLTPNFTYNNFPTYFDFLGDFELGNDFQTLNDSVPLLITENPNEVFEGNRSAKLSLNAQHPQFVIATIDSYNLPAAGKPVFLELHYRCEAPFQISLIFFQKTGDVDNYPVMFVNDKLTWNKIYANMGNSVTDVLANGGKNIRIAITGNLPDSLSTANFYFDNIKLVHQN
ncbi:MAG: hypothetical protein IT272_08550 [Chitinophagales bacterium]|jgi:hypothetical protein|nr:hypothetical protein [Sphingobacteriales bacterium]MBP9141611.1 hypothetical protein [Chitinophagales bacterium]MDA0198475.1 hypothetical protein [Bacteroidota bacterium]MBK6890790.1 hypothetical protein [Sphingobacteriales bacterium]MBK8677871.1 hypothetical protein [Sphingobacteriales bacterium]